MEQSLSHIISHCFVNIPFAEFGNNEHLVSQYRINPQIGLDGDELNTISRHDFLDSSKYLSSDGLSCTLDARLLYMLPGDLVIFVLE